MKFLGTFSMILVTALVCSCASKPAVPPKPDYIYEKNAVKLHLVADPRLNLFDGIPHALSICIYQLKDRNTFDQLTQDKTGLSKLLAECNRFDQSVTSAERVFIQPGDDLWLTRDRYETAEHLALVAGYYLPTKDRCVKIIDFPVMVEKTGTFSSTVVSRVGVLNAKVTLGVQQIDKLEVK
jgi:type VI secretion system VasD/TssJ family lipoprotein